MDECLFEICGGNWSSVQLLTDATTPPGHETDDGDIGGSGGGGVDVNDGRGGGDNDDDSVRGFFIYKSGTIKS